MEIPLNDTFGLDIRDNALAAVELDIDKKEVKVVNSSRVELAPGIIDEDSIILNPEAFKQALAKLLEKGVNGPIKPRNVIISIPEEKTFSHYLNVPSEHAMDYDWIVQKAKDYVPIDLSEASIDFKRLSKPSEQKEVNFDFVAVQKSIVKSLISHLESAGLKIVAIDVRKNSLIRACQNPFEKMNENFLVVNMDDEETLLSIRNQSSVTHTLSLATGGNGLIRQINEKYEFNSVSKVRSLIEELKKDPLNESEDSKKVQEGLGDFLESLHNKALELYRLADNTEPMEVEKIFVMGSSMYLAGLPQTLKKAFPKASVINRFDYVDINGETEKYYLNAIGLSLRSLFTDYHNKEVNLLPHVKQEELFSERATPRMAWGFMGVLTILAVAIVFAGMDGARKFLDYSKSSRELAISSEETKNPYLNQAVQATQQKAQLESQILTILRDALPLGAIIRKMDGYNVESTGLVNVSYSLDFDGTKNLSMRARSASRENTEKLIETMRKDQYYLDVISPLSNLVGKGERFIQIDMILEGGLRTSAPEDEELPVVESADEESEVKESPDESSVDPKEGEENSEETDIPDEAEEITDETNS